MIDNKVESNTATEAKSPSPPNLTDCRAQLAALGIECKKNIAHLTVVSIGKNTVINIVKNDITTSLNIDDIYAHLSKNNC